MLGMMHTKHTRVNMSFSDEDLGRIDAYAKAKGLNRSAAVMRAIEDAEEALSLRDVRRAAAAKFLEMNQFRLGVQELQVDHEGQLVKGSESEVEANRARFEAHRLEQLTKLQQTVSSPPDRRRYGGSPKPAPGERIVEDVDPEL